MHYSTTRRCIFTAPMKIVRSPQSYRPRPALYADKQTHCEWEGNIQTLSIHTGITGLLIGSRTARPTDNTKYMLTRGAPIDGGYAIVENTTFILAIPQYVVPQKWNNGDCPPGHKLGKYTCTLDGTQPIPFPSKGSRTFMHFQSDSWKFPSTFFNSAIRAA